MCSCLKKYSCKPSPLLCSCDQLKAWYCFGPWICICTQKLNSLSIFESTVRICSYLKSPRLSKKRMTWFLSPVSCFLPDCHFYSWQEQSCALFCSGESLLSVIWSQKWNTSILCSMLCLKKFRNNAVFINILIVCHVIIFKEKFLNYKVTLMYISIFHVLLALL